MTNRTSFLEVPQHVIEDYMFVRNFPFTRPDNKGKHGSLTTIFSVWNAMVGTGLVTIPWAYSQSGLVLGILITFTTFLVSFFTCFLVIKSAGDDGDYTDTLKKYMGKTWWSIGMCFFIANLMVAIIL